MPVGWFAGVGWNITDWIAIVGQAGADYRTEQANPPYPLGPFPAAHGRTQAWLGGPRVSHQLTTRITLYGQTLFGYAHRDVTRYVASLNSDVSGGYRHFAWQPGGGIDVGLAPRLQLRLSGDYRLTPMEGLISGSAIRQPRFAIGLAFRP
jgi:hypothetical protein